MEYERINFDEVLEKVFEEKPPASPEEKKCMEKLYRCECSRLELDRVIKLLAKQYNLDFDTLKDRFMEATSLINNPVSLEVLAEKYEHYILLILGTHPVVKFMEELKREHSGKDE